MRARDVMTRDVAVANPDTPSRDVAALLLSRGISAVPIVDSGDVPIGMVSEGDLVGRDEAARQARRDWWLALLAEGNPLHDDFLASLRSPERLAREIMSSPVVTVEEDTSVTEIARLLATYRIKRVPVIRDGRIVGIVSRADLLRALATEQFEPSASEGSGPRPDLFSWIDHHFHHDRRSAPDQRTIQSLQPAGQQGLRVDDFRALVSDFAHHQERHQDAERHALAERRRQQAKELIDHHISDENWRALLHQARQAAEHGEREFMLLRFPGELCSDGGRAVNAPDPRWPETLRGEAAEMYLRWEHDLKPRGFHLAARTLEFPGGMPGDIGLFLIWGE
jgi:CBS domain-containing protein